MNLKRIFTRANSGVVQAPAEGGFSFVEVCVAIVVSVMFGAAAFATNQQLLTTLRAQKETTAATMMLQERIESFRATAWSNIADKDYVKNNIVRNSTTSEATLGSLTETITVSGYVTTAGAAGYPTDGSNVNQWVRDDGHPTGHTTDHNDNLATNYNLLKVDILLTWNGPNGRTRTRELAQIFGKGNIGQ
ncbi:MAG: hypothetical protein DMF06_02865 [Verrucomicrobia bacterium]|jgi:hypothetical protein|nr:MAG: hypothetical protein DMF06_02865 [Verrucomicrobiota bacterium]